MRASTPTKLSLARWFQLMGVHPLHAAGVQLDSVQAISCSSPWVQYDWQASDVVSREEVARAIRQAEDDIEVHVGYRLLPSWEVDERHRIERPFKPEGIRFGNSTARGFRPAVASRYGHVISGGVRATTTLGLARPITYSDADADNYDETATVTATATGLTEECEIRTYYPGHVGEDAYEIRPTVVVLAGGTATITFRRELAVLLSIQDAMIWETPTGTTNANFLATVDVARLYTDPQTQATMLWEPSGDCSCGSSVCSECSYATQTGCLTPVEDPRLGMWSFAPATWDATDAVFDAASWASARAPDQIRMWYYGGYRDEREACPRRDLARVWEIVVARYAASLLDRPTCQCAARGVERWQEDLAFFSGAEQLSRYRVSKADLDSPFGTRRGAVQAWKAIVRPGAAIARNVTLA